MKYEFLRYIVDYFKRTLLNTNISESTVAIKTTIEKVEKVEEELSLKPFIRWAGGKQNLVNDLIKYTPNLNNIHNYYEPFVGAGSLFFKSKFKNAILSDLNSHLINAYQAIKNTPVQLHNILEDHREKLSREYYYLVREQYNANLDDHSVEQAARFIFLIHTSFNGIYRVNQQGCYNVPFGKNKPALPTLEHLNLISQKLSGVDLNVGFYDEILPYTKAKDFIYLDPPYPPLNDTSSFRHYTINKFSDLDQGNVADFADHLSSKGCFVMVSNADTPLIRDLFRKWDIISLPTTRYVSCKAERKVVNELIIKNY